MGDLTAVVVINCKDYMKATGWMYIMIHSDLKMIGLHV